MATAIPVLDLRHRTRSEETFARALRAALAEFGFVGVREHGIEDALVRRAFDAARAFFALPLAEKLRCEVKGGAGQRGYTRPGVEKAKDQTRSDLKEFFHVGREAAAEDPLARALRPNVWPREAAGVLGFREAQLALFASLERLGAELLAALARSLELAPDWFAPRIERGNSILRAIHYPPVPAGTSSVRAAAHEDINLITLLVGSDEPGLQIRTRTGEWIPVTTLPGTIVVNAGDMLQRLTNDRIPSTTHRVVNPPAPWSERSRYSIPFFLHFNPDVVIETLPGCIGPDRPDRYPVSITADEFLRERLREIGLLRY